ncbi:MAG: hypothetical protein NTY02_18970, partial [Acidobacteria bacterium]|nr:hypothetical protein [Acidobacteriota bacterium]
EHRHMNKPGLINRLATRFAAEAGLDSLVRSSAQHAEALARVSRAIEQLDARLARLEADVRDQAPKIEDIPKVRLDLSKLRQRSEEMRGELGRRGLAGQLRRIGQDVRAMLRLEVIDADSLPYPYRLFARRANLVSQNEEDGIALAIFKEAGAGSRRFLDIGSGSGGGVAAVFAREFGWRGVMIDGDEEHIRIARHRFGETVDVVHAFVQRDTVNDLVRGHGLEGDIDLFSLDIDVVDYWIWEALTAVSPRLVVVEYNPLLGLDRAVTVPYDPAFDRHRFPVVLSKRYFGASLPAFCRLGTRKGYRLVATDSSAINAFFLRCDVAPHIPELQVADLPYRVSDIGKHEDLFETAERAGLQFVEVE